MKNVRLINLRKKHDLTQEELANIVNTSQSNIARIEAGERDPRKNLKIKIAKLFDVSVEWLFYEQIDDLKSLSRSQTTA
jgi:putative transcriptional regulator